ncbi:MAG: UvrD-helicase domain-containing protein [Lentisphaeria bacterium]|nr:UvrD-helicase domain-containing protein [Lentisphaeria bacterium]
MPSVLHGLNDQQREAVTTTEGPLLLLAGAGTGKTRVITCRVAYLIEQGVKPENILAVTFTNKAAREMGERLEKLVGAKTARDLTACTFHSFGARFLRKHIHRLGYNRNFDIAPQGYQVGLVKAILGETGQRDGVATLYHSLISKAKSRLLMPDEVDIGENGIWQKGFRDVYALYQSRMKNMDSLDFDDLLLLTVKTWEKCPDVLATCQQTYHYLLIDEYQDTNGAQFQLMKMLAGDRRNICVVGDDDQSIYGWRGADVGNILSFDKHFPGAKILRLEENYRSTNTILKAANAVIANNSQRHAKVLWSAKGDGETILSVPVNDETAEANFIADFIKEKTFRKRAPHSSFAVLYRSNAQSRVFEQVLRQRRVPYRLVGGKSFYERREVLDAVSFLKLVNNPKDNLSLLRILNVPPRGLGDKAVTHLREMGEGGQIPLEKIMRSSEWRSLLTPAAADAAKRFVQAIDKAREALKNHHPLAAATRTLLTDLDYLDGLARMYKPREDALRRRDNVYEFLNALGEYEERAAKPALADFLERHALSDDNDKVDETGEDGVTLTTIHAAKGLEFPIVFLVGLEQGLFPHRVSLEEGNEAEERRLFYVAVTRARDELVITNAAKRRIQGRSGPQRPSAFLKELPEDLVTLTTPSAALKPASQEEVSDFLAQLKSQFAPGK